MTLSKTKKVNCLKEFLTRLINKRNMLLIKLAWILLENLLQSATIIFPLAGLIMSLGIFI